MLNKLEGETLKTGSGTMGGYYERIDNGDGTYSQLVKQAGSKVQEQLTEANAVTGTLTFAAPIKTIEIYNTDTVNSGVFNVNGINITVPKDTSFQADIGGTPRATVTVTGATTYIVTRYV